MTTEAELKAAADPQILSDLVLANRILYALGVLDGYGHVSARDPRHPQHFFLSRALAPALVKAGDIMAYDLDSRPGRCACRGAQPFADHHSVQHQQDRVAPGLPHELVYPARGAGVRDPRGCR